MHRKAYHHAVAELAKFHNLVLSSMHGAPISVPMSQERHFVYLILSTHGEIYAGMTSSLKNRLGRHNSPHNTGWTRNRRWYLLAVKEFDTRGKAMVFERKLKRDGRSKRRWIEKSARQRLSVLCARHDIACERYLPKDEEE